MKSRVSPWVVTVVLAMATFMEVLDTSVANVSLGHIAGGLGAGLDESTWVLTTYLVANAVMMPISGWLGTVFGLKRFYLICVSIFTVSSLLCGLATQLDQLIFFRILQGVGGAGMAPVVQAMIAELFPPAKRGMAFAIYGLAVVFAPAIGPTLGGWITDNYSWHWVFLINIPVGIVSFLLTAWLVTEPPSTRIERDRLFQNGFRIDAVGFGLSVLGIGCLEYFVDRGQREDWFASGMITGMAITSVVSLAALVWWELRRRDPIVDIPLLKVPSFLAAFVTMFSLGFVLFGSTALLPQFLEQLLGYTASQAGLALTAGGVAMIVMMPLVGGYFVRKFPGRNLVIAGLLMEAASLFHMTGFNLEIPFEHAVWARVFQTVGLAFLFIPITQAAYANLPPGKSGNAAALINLARNLGGSVGIAITSTIVAQRSQFHQSRLGEHVSAYSPETSSAIAHLSQALGGGPEGTLKALGSIYQSVLRQAAMLAYVDVFLFMAIGTLCIIPLALFLPKSCPKSEIVPH
ncbi:MAG: DHA2 family efflux MFS transporter permease subunit [Verrucomicrobiaceae bacterium]|nr:MAG: DHA2 family efflux MFS transporter permease subunit [Verrucomicrobiaceae bacterium]